MSKVNSKRINAIFIRDFKEYGEGISFELLAAGSVFATFVICIKTLLSGGGMQELKLTLNNTLLLFALIPPIGSIPLFATTQLTKDKTNGTIANLLATPASPKEIVRGKSLAIFLTGFIIGILAPLIILLVINFGVIIPAHEIFYKPVSLLLAVFIITPVFCYGLTEFSIQLSMIKSPDVAIAPSYLIGFALALGIPMCSVMGVIDIASCEFLLIYAGITAVMWILVLVISKMLTKEQIIMVRV